MKPLSGRIALVTGAARGIGKAIATLLAQRGAHVVVSDVDLDAAQATAQALQEHGVETLAVKADVSEPQEVAGLLEGTLSRFQKLDILVNNAGITRDGLLLRMKDEDWDRVLEVNLKGAFLCTRAALRSMSRQRYGRIVNIASIVGAMGNVGQANYAASKAGLMGFTKTVAREYANRGITANAVAPGFIDTPMTQALPEAVRSELLRLIPMARLGTPEDVAHAVGFLVSEEAGYITGQVLHVNGGMYM